MLADPVFLACALAVMVGALIQSTGGIGFAMFAAPIVAILRPDMVPGPMILAGGLVSLLIAAREFRNIDYRGAAIAIGGRIPGSIVAGLIIGVAQHGLDLSTAAETYTILTVGEGLVTRSTAVVGATASPMQNEPLWRVALQRDATSRWMSRVSM